MRFLHALTQSPDGLLWASGDTLAAFGVAANQPPATNYAAVSVRNGHLVLAFDHRMSDGMRAAAFLSELRDRLES